MSSYHKESLKSALLIAVCCAVIGVALFGLGRMIQILVWNARVHDFRLAMADSMRYAEDNNAMHITVNDDEPLWIRFNEVGGIHHYLVNYPRALPAARAKPGGSTAVIDCGDGSTLRLYDAGERRIWLYYRTPDGRIYRATLQYQTKYDGWDAFLRIVYGESRPGG